MHVISNQSLSIMQLDSSPSQSFKETQNDQEGLIRQGYTVQASGGQTFVLLNALHREDLFLAKVLKPDFSKAVEMAVGVRVFRVRMLLPCHFFSFIFCPSYYCYAESRSRSTHLVDILARGHQKVI